jgi:hypothetical protein
MTLNLRIPGVTFTDSTLPILSRDSIIKPGTKFVYDFANPYSWVKQAAPANGDAVKSLLPSAADATVYIGASTSMQFTGGGFKFDNELLEGVLIPDSAGMLAANNDGFIYTIWIKHLTQLASNNQALISGNTYQTGNENQYSCSYVWADSTYRMRADGIGPGNIALAANEIAQLAIAYLPDGAGGHKARLYKNGVQIGSDVATSGALNVPSTTGRAVGIGNSVGQNSGFSHDWTGMVYRTWLEDIAASQPTSTLRAAYADAQVAKDYAQNLSRFS